MFIYSYLSAGFLRKEFGRITMSGELLYNVMEKICAQCGEAKSDCMVTINEAIQCERQIICSGCRETQSGDARIISSDLDLFSNAVNTKTAGGDLNGYKFRLRCFRIMATPLPSDGCS